MNETLAILKKAGYKFKKKDWPLIPKEKLQELGITPEKLYTDFRPATLTQTLGPNYSIGFNLGTYNGHYRPMAIKK